MAPRKRGIASILYSLRGRLLFLVCLSTMPAVLFTFAAAESEREAVLARTERDALHFASLASREHANQIRGARELLSWLGTKLGNEGRESPIVTDSTFLQALLAGHPQLANIGVLSPEGTVLRSAHPLESYRSWREHPAYLASMRSDEVVTGTYLVSPIFERPTLNHAYAVRDDTGEVMAVLFNGLDLGWLSGMARRASLSEGFFLLVSDREGRVLAHGDSGALLAAAGGELRVGELPALAQSGRGKMLEIPGTGARRYFVAAPLEAAPELFVAVGLPYERVVGQANAAFYRTLIALLVLTSFTIAAVFVAAELGILRALRSLARAARGFGSGDLAVRAPIPRGHNELASLASTFNEMAAHLAARHREAVNVQARLRALSNRLQMAREAEAARISRELHDEIGQVLTRLKIDLARLCASCGRDDASRACAKALEESAAAMREQIDAAIDFVRRIASELRPGVLDKLGLGAAIEWQAREIEARTELAVDVDMDWDELDSEVDGLVAVTLFRIAQEALTNVVRHAEATVAEIRLVGTADELVLSIQDDGKGIEPSALESDRSLGIAGMRERANLIHGRLSVEGATGRGTTVTVTVPRRAAKEEIDESSPG